MSIDRNEGLEQYEIECRDELIASIVVDLKLISETYNIKLPIDKYKSYMEPHEACSIVLGSTAIRFDDCYIRGQARNIEKDVKTFITKEIFAKVHGLDFESHLLRGSAYSVALKLAAIYFFGEGGWLRGEMQYHDFNLDYIRREIDIDLYTIVENVEEMYEKRYMRYKLWHRKAVEQLGVYLFRGNDEFIVCMEGAFEVDSESEKLSIDAFFEEVYTQIKELPFINCTEIMFPEPCFPESASGAGVYFMGEEMWREGYLFSEFVPVKYMDDENRQWLYDAYLSWFE